MNTNIMDNTSILIMDNFNNKTLIPCHQHSHTEPTPRYTHSATNPYYYHEQSISIKQVNATSCLLLISEADNDDANVNNGNLKEYGEEFGESRVEVTPWVYGQVGARKVSQGCGRSKTSMLLPPCGHLGNQYGKHKLKKILAQKGENKENYLSAQKLIRENRPSLIIGKKNSADIKNSYSVLSKNRDIDNRPQPQQSNNIKISLITQTKHLHTMPNQPKKQSKPNIVYILQDISSPSQPRPPSYHRHIKTQISTESVHMLTPFTIGQCNFSINQGARKKNSKICSSEASTSMLLRDGHKGVDSQGTDEKNQKQKQKDMGKENNTYWKIKKKIEESIEKQSHIRIPAVLAKQKQKEKQREKKMNSTQAKRYIKYSKSKIKQQLSTNEPILKHKIQTLHDSSNPLSKNLYEKYFMIVNRCV